MTYTFRSASGEVISTDAYDEAEARRLTMVKLHGSRPDNVTPNAPNYVGYGLSLIDLM